MRIIVPAGESLVVEFAERPGIYVDIMHRPKEVKVAINPDPVSIETEDDLVYTITFAEKAES